MALRPSLKRGVPGSVPPWRAPCFSWPCRGFGLPGVFLRGAAMVFCFQTLEIVTEPLGLLLKPLLARLKLPARASPNKIHGCKSLLSQLLPSRDAQLRPTTRSRNKSSGGARSSSISKSLGLSALRAVETAPLRRGARFVEKASLTLVQLSAFAFPLKLYCEALLSATRAHGCCCWQPFAGHRA